MLDRLLQKFGYQLTRFPSTFPYQRHFNFLNTQFDFWIQDAAAQKWYDHTFWQDVPELQLLQSMLCTDSNILDFGAHYGFLGTFLAKNLGPNGTYTAIELLPRAAMYAQAQLALNHMGHLHQVINAAGAAESGHNMHYNDHQAGNASISLFHQNHTISTITGDQVLETKNAIDLLKIDVEGYEVEVLKGCQAILESLPILALEVHLQGLLLFGHSIEDVFDLLPLQHYQGTMLWNPGQGYIRPDQHEIYEFKKSKIPQEGIVNLFLWPV